MNEILRFILKRMGIFFSFLLIILLIERKLNIGIDLYIFLFTFLIMRRKFGGFHLQNLKLCFLSSIIFPFLIYFIIDGLDINKLQVIIIFLFSFLILNYTGVVDSSKRRLKKEIKEKLHVQGKILMFLMLIVLIISGNKFILAAIVMTAISCLGGRIIGRTGDM